MLSRGVIDVYKHLSAQLWSYIKQVSLSFWETLVWTALIVTKFRNFLSTLLSIKIFRGITIFWILRHLLPPKPKRRLFLHNFSKGDCILLISYDLSMAIPMLDNPLMLDELQTTIRNTWPTILGENGISAKFLKGLSDDCLHTLLHIFNDIFDSRILPAP